MLGGSTSRRQPTRSVRTTASRPTNYYAKPFANVAVDNDPPSPVAPGFFPAITHFTDGIAALPRDVMRHLTMLKETEGKAYQPDQAITDLVAAISKLPDPPRQQAQSRSQAFLGLSMANSLAGSVNGSVIDGSAPRQQQTPFDPTQSSQLQAPPDEHHDQRQTLYGRLLMKIREMTAVLDEKAMVLSAANDTLSRDLQRMDSSLPHIESEISEEARLGSNTHWALPHMKDTRRPNAGHSERSRRDVTNVNSLAAAAAAVHEGEIAATRSEARREAMLAKRNRLHNVDSDFDDRAASRRQNTSTKVRKANDSVLDARANGQSHKRRRVEKSTAAFPERSLGAALNGRLVQGRASPRETPAADGSRKRTKPLSTQAISRKRNAPNSPSIASSPTRGTFATSSTRQQSPAPGGQRPATSRARQGSTQSLAQDNSRGRPASALSTRRGTMVGNGSGGAAEETAANSSLRDANGRADTVEPAEARTEARDAAPATEDAATDLRAQATKSEKNETSDPRDALDNDEDTTAMPTEASHARHGSRSSKPATPVTGTFGTQPMVRSRSTRGANNGSAAATMKPSSPSLPPAAASPPRRSHKKGGSTASAVLPKSLSSSPERLDGAADDDDAEEADEGDEDEPRYCHCGEVSFGDMIACDNATCPHEWFHLPCVNLTEVPKDNRKWYCSPECRNEARKRSRR